MITNIERAEIETQADIDEESAALDYDMVMAEAQDETLEEYHQRREAAADTAYWEQMAMNRGTL